LSRLNTSGNLLLKLDANGEQTMKFTLTAILLITGTIGTLVSSTVSAAETKLYSAMGHPYKLLITRSEQVKIIYSEANSNIDCRVEVSWQNNLVTTPAVKVKKQDFTDKPLASCLPRVEAKKLLARTFS